jgi:lipid-A-disaccharide synthase
MSAFSVDNTPYKIALVCAEPSGDMLGSGLVKQLLRRYPNAQIKGIGGELCQAQGLHSWFDMNELSVMGLFEVIKHLPRLLAIRKSLKQQLLNFQPDIYVGVDAPDFNLPIEAFLKNKGIKTVHYVSPTIWAWRESRVHKIKRAADCVMGLFPFEAPVFAKYHVNYEFVGHPMADAIDLSPDKSSARKRFNLGDNESVVALLPGSRGSEVQQLLPIFLDSLEQMQVIQPNIKAIIPAVNAARESQILKILAHYPNTVVDNVLVTREVARTAMIASDAVLLSSGTATLEAMLCKRPMLSVYKMSGLTYRMMQRLYKPKYFSLPNILANEPLVPELLQDDVDPSAISHYMVNLLTLSDNLTIDEANDAYGDVELIPVKSKGSCLFTIDSNRLTYILSRFTQLHYNLAHDADNQAANVVAQYLSQPHSKIVK